MMKDEDEAKDEDILPALSLMRTSSTSSSSSSLSTSPDTTMKVPVSVTISEDRVYLDSWKMVTMRQMRYPDSIGSNIKYESARPYVVSYDPGIAMRTLYGVASGNGINCHWLYTQAFQRSHADAIQIDQYIEITRLARIYRVDLSQIDWVGAHKKLAVARQAPPVQLSEAFFSHVGLQELQNQGKLVSSMEVLVAPIIFAVTFKSGCPPPKIEVNGLFMLASALRDYFIFYTSMPQRKHSCMAAMLAMLLWRYVFSEELKKVFDGIAEDAKKIYEIISAE